MTFSNYTYDILTQKIEQMNSNGLFLFPLPTGSGKTYNVIKYIKENYKTKKIIFVSSQLKLLPSLKEFKKDLSPQEAIEIEKQFLKIPAIIDSYKSFCYKYKDEESMKKYEDLQELFKYVKCHEEHSDPDLNEYYYNKFNDKELEFRKKIKKHFSKNSEFKEADYEYLKELYPACEIGDKNIIILSAKKFFFPIDTIINGSIYLPTEKIKDCVIFFDEFDAIKDELLDVIVKNNDYYKIDCIKLVRKIFENSYNLSGTLLFDDIINYPEKTEEYINKGNDIIDNIKKYINTYSDLYYHIKLPFINEKKDEHKTFIFKDRKSTLVTIDNQTQSLKYKTDIDKISNLIYKFDKKLEIGEKSIRSIIDNSIYLLKNFMYNILKLSRFYFEYHFKVRGNNNINLMESINSIIDRMDFGQEYKSFLVKEIFNLTKIKEIESSDYEIDGKRDRRRRKYDFYYDGFSYIKLVDSDNERLETKIFFNMFNLTPETMMLKVASMYKVVGISATAKFNTCIKNFDNNFFKYKLDTNYIDLTDEEMEQIKKLYENESQDYEVSIDKTSGNNNYLLEQVINITKDKELFKKDIELIKLKYKTRLQDVCNILLEYDKFLKRAHHHSFIYFLSFNLNNYEELKNIILQNINRIKNNDGENHIAVVDKYFFENANYDEKMKNYKKVFLISCYQTVGVGVNLQYSIPCKEIFNDDNLIICNPQKREKDIDGCYLSKVTNIIPHVQEYDELEDVLLAKILFYLEYLKANDEINYNKFNEAITTLFNNQGYFIGKYSKIKDICVAATKVIVQAIGRICRTKNKNKEVYISYSQANDEFLKPIKDYLSTFFFNKEFQTVLDKIIITKYNNLEAITISNIETFKECKELLKWPWDKIRMKEWDDLREFVLKHPTADDSDFKENLRFKNFYFKLSEPLNCYSVDKYNYTKKIDINISKNSNGLLEKRLYVSEEDCKLNLLMKNEYFKNYFMARGYATFFQTKKYIMSPHLYNAIYKGALGEAIGSACFSKYNISINSIIDPKVYELFDYHKNDVYFDFKKWHSSFKISEKDQIDNINKKMNYGNIKKAYIINVLFEGYYDKEIEGLLYKYENKNIITISWLYDVYTGKFNEGALIDIKNSLFIFK